MPRICKLGLAATLTLLFVASMAMADTVTYTDRSTWLANAPLSSGVTTQDFSGIAPNASHVDAYNWNLGTMNMSSSALIAVVDSNFMPYYFNWGSGAVVQAGKGVPLTFNLPYTTGFGIDLMTISGFAGTVTATINSVNYNVSTANYPTRTFFGIGTTNGFTSVTLQSTGGYLAFDNVSYGDNPAPVPEPSSMILLGTGLLALRRRLKK